MTFWLIMQLCSLSGDNYKCKRNVVPHKTIIECEKRIGFYTQGTGTKTFKKLYEGEKPSKGQMGIKERPVCLTDQEYKAIKK